VPCTFCLSLKLQTTRSPLVKCPEVFDATARPYRLS
jgi:hypothetical protein